MKKFAIFGAPRSGTSWLSQLYNSHPDVALRFQPLFSFGHKGALAATSSRAEIERFFDEIWKSTDEFALMASRAHENFPQFRKSESATHIGFKETRYLGVVDNMLRQCPDLRVVGIVRNPLANLASWVKAPKEFDPSWNIAAEWREAKLKNQGRPEEFYGFEKWKWVASTFLEFGRRFPSQFSLVAYSELNRHTLQSTLRLFEFCGLAMHEQVREFIAASKSRHDADPYSVYRGEASDENWSGVLPGEMVATIRAELAGSELEMFLD